MSGDVCGEVFDSLSTWGTAGMPSRTSTALPRTAGGGGQLGDRQADIFIDQAEQDGRLDLGLALHVDFDFARRWSWK